jgi:enoyl-CoA hydratase/carnithine racemase
MSTSNPPTVSCCTITFPTPNILLVTLNTPKQLNVITTKAHIELDTIWKWFDSTPSLIIAIFTGSGRAFSGGADLREWQTIPAERRGITLPNGFGGLSMRRGKKPIIAAMNGFSIGGSTEMVINCDMVVANSKAYLALPDVKVGLTGFGGTFPRLVRRIGKNRATDMCLTGRNVGVEEAHRWGLVDRIVDESKGKTTVEVAIELAKEIASHSPDAIIATRDGLMAGEDGMDAVEAGRTFQKKWLPIVLMENCLEGIVSPFSTCTCCPSSVLLMLATVSLHGFSRAEVIVSNTCRSACAYPFPLPSSPLIYGYLTMYPSSSGYRLIMDFRLHSTTEESQIGRIVSYR